MILDNMFNICDHWHVDWNIMHAVWRRIEQFHPEQGNENDYRTIRQIIMEQVIIIVGYNHQKERIMIQNGDVCMTAIDSDNQ